MAVKKCCIENCNSSSTRPEDIGVTYHKFPKETTLRGIWVSVTHYLRNNIDSLTYVCSRHFCKSDFQIYQDSKYVLKSDAVPSIFSWTIKNKSDVKMDSQSTSGDLNYEVTDSPVPTRKMSGGENLEAIRRYIEAQEREIEELEKQKNEVAIKPALSSEKEFNGSDFKGMPSKGTMDIIEQGDKVVIATNMIDMILKEDEVKKSNTKSKQLSPKEKGGCSVALSVGSRVEVKDFNESWYAADIIEVDYEEMEVLVHYESICNKPDEWISVSSPRLRPFKSISIPNLPSSEMEIKEDKQDDKTKLKYMIGERCLARWRDNRRFIATVCGDFGDGSYEVMFDDGAKWKCPLSRMYKLKESKSELTVDTSVSPTPSTPSPTLNEPGSSGSYPVITSTIPFHKHLFDPTRDYLGSKSERREMKRKLNIKEIFNIGQKKQKTSKSLVDKVKVVKEKKPRIKKKVEPPVEDIKIEIKQEIPDAVASIIGTVDSEIKEDEPPKSPKEDELPKSPKEDELPKSPKEDEPSKTLEENEPTKSLIEHEPLMSLIEHEPLKSLIEHEPPKSLIEHEPPKSLIEYEPSKVLKEDGPPMTPKQDDPPTSPQLKITEEVESLVAGTPEVKTDKLEISQKMDVEEYEEVRVDPNEELIEEESMDTLVNNIALDDLVVPSDLGFEKCQEFEQAVLEEETKLEKFDKPDESKQEVIEKMKEVINKLEDGLRVDSPKPELVIKLDKIKYDTMEQPVKKQKLKVKVKKSKKVKLQEKKVKKQVKKVASDLQQMKKQMKEMKKNMLIRTEHLSMGGPYEMPESYLLPGEWCCKWVNGQPVGIVSEVEVDARDGKAVLPRRSVQVEDKRLPPGWSKHIVRRSLGQSVGKWDVVLVSPDNRRIHTKTDMKSYLEHLNDETLKPYEAVLLDFGAHLKLSRRLGWYQCGNAETLPVDNKLSPIVRSKRYQTQKKRIRKSKKAKNISLNELPSTSDQAITNPETPMEVPLLEDGYVYVGSLKVQIIDTLLRCPADGCFKNFRNNTLLQMHIKHYHPELRELLGATPKVLDLARERTKPTDLEPKPRQEVESKIIKVKIARPPKRSEEPKKDKESVSEIHDMPITKLEGIPRSQDSPKLRQALNNANKPVKRPKVLLPVRRPEPEPEPAPELPPELEVEPEQEEEIDFSNIGLETDLAPELGVLDFEKSISTHTVTKPFDEVARKCDKKRRCISTISKRPISEDDEWYGMNSDIETRSSFPGSGTPDSKTMDKPGQPIVSSESNEEPKDCDMYMFTETGERVKIEHMKREEIINCHCGYREEDGLMVQCELCLCWQHALCHNIHREAEVPEKYTCSICLNPRRGRRSKRFLHDQDRLYEGLLPGAKPCEILRRSHELSGNLLRMQDSLHALRVKYHVATKKNHPKLYLWAKDWESTEISMTQERLNSDYSDLNIVNNIGKENLPVVTEEIRESHLDMRSPIGEEFSQRDGSFLGLSTGLSSLSGTSLDLPITTSELETLARSVEETSAHVIAPQPEAPIENSVCRERLLRHVQRTAALIDAKFDSFEAQIVELESQDPSFEDDETADYFPRTKQTILMLMRDLETLEELGIIT